MVAGAADKTDGQAAIQIDTWGKALALGVTVAGLLLSGLVGYHQVVTQPQLDRLAVLEGQARESARDRAEMLEKVSGISARLDTALSYLREKR